MLSLANKRLLLGVTGGIAAYKSAELVRRFKTSGAEVRVVMTAAGQEFITPLTLQALSGNEVHVDLLDTKAEAGMGHIELARWADLLVVAPATADFISKAVAGEGSDLLSTLFLACSAPKVLAPAMNQAMWSSPATQENVATLIARGVTICGPASGEQACGDVGPGRMEEPDAIAVFCASLFETGALAGKHVVISAGPTREAIDPVRYISNHSSGQMGYALAEAAMEAGAKVTLVSGPVSISPPDSVQLQRVESALEMHEACLALSKNADLFIGAAAVADYRIAEPANNKIKKKGERELTLTLVQNPDIIRDVAAMDDAPFVVGFAAETNDVVAYARAKLERKKLDMIIANDVSDQRIGFNSEHNAVHVIGRNFEQRFDIAHKRRLARDLIALIAQKMTVDSEVTE